MEEESNFDEKDLEDELHSEQFGSLSLLACQSVWVKGVPKLKDDVLALTQLTESKYLPKRHIKGKQRVCVARYGFGDTTGWVWYFNQDGK